METKPTREGAGANPAWAPVSTVERVAERLGSADARTIYGDPVERNGTTVIPVAKVRFGFGGGAGRKLSTGEGDGAGGGATITPVGFIELGRDGARFRRIRAMSPALTALGLAVAVWLVALAIHGAPPARR